MNLERFRELLQPLTARYDLAAASVRSEKVALREAKAKVQHALSAQALVQEVAEAIQSKAHRQLAGIVSRCLTAVFGEEGGGFRIDFEKKNGRTQARLSFVRDGHELAPGDDGGGALDVASFALRIACLVMSQPPRRRFLALDEPWKHLSVQFRPAMRALVEKLAEELEIQFLIVTHSRHFMIGNVIELGTIEGRS